MIDAYVELHCHSFYSLLDGASSPEALVNRAAAAGMPALALTDHDALYGAVGFNQAARAHGLKPIFGAELTLEDGSHLTLLVEDERGWENLCWLTSQAQSRAPKGQASLARAALEGHTGGLVVLSGCRRGPVAAALLGGESKAARAAAAWLLDLFGVERCWIELQHHLLPDDDKLVAELLALARSLGLGIVATNNVHYATRDGSRLQDVLVCVRTGKTLDEAGRLRRPNSECYLKSAIEMDRLFAELPAALQNSLRIAERCQFALPSGLQELPRFPVPDGTAPAAYLRQLCEQGLVEHYGTSPRRAREQLARELGVIERSGLVNYFLVVWDVVRFAREQGILCQGRGSACNSLVAYLLGISPIDPLEHQLVFERFLSDERPVAPDIDMDFDAARREEVIQYVYERYGREHAAMACTFSTYQARGAIRDVGKALGIPPTLLDQAAKGVDGWQRGSLQESESLRALANEAPIWQHLLDLATEIAGVPRHLGIHNGGMVLTRQPLSTRVPTEPAAMAGRTVVQWDKDALEDAGMIKLDILGLRMLSAIAETVEIVAATTGEWLDLARLRFDDPLVFEMICRADTIGCFQIESRAQAQVLPRLQPRCFNDLVISISLIRPGPLQGQMVHPFLRRRRGEEAVSYAHPCLKPVLGETLGVILFQEQVLKVAEALAGFSGGKGELLRRALGKKHATEALERFRGDFLEGAQARGVPREIAERVFEQLKGFGSYSFAKSHAAAFAVLVYWSAYLKYYHPAAFFCALLNSQPMGFWSPRVLIGDARRHGVVVLPASVNASEARCTVAGDVLRVGLSYVKGLGETGSERVVAVRAGKPFVRLIDFCRRTQLPKRLVENLIRAGAMDEWRRPRRQLLWELGTLQYDERELDLEFPLDGVELPPLSELEALAWEHELLGFSTGEHLMAYYRPWLVRQGILSSEELERCTEGWRGRVAGVVAVHQAPPTAKGVHFVTLEDEVGLVNVVVRPDVYVQYRAVLRGSPLLLVEGRVQRKEQVTNLVAERVAVLRDS